jgi:[ribosomal protein S18]-alanine N-acetyltransferase
MRVRPLTDADLSLVRVWMRDDPEAPAWSDDDLAALVRMPSGDLESVSRGRVRSGWIAEEGQSTVVGFAVAAALCVPGTPAECELEFVLVPPSARRQGIGRLLIHALFAWASNIRAHEIRLEVRASNTRALRLYERCGFVVTGHRPGYYVDPSEDAVLMRCRIGNVPGDAPV